MKNEPWIDRVYKEKIESWDLPLDPKQWDQAASLIDIQNQSRRKRIIWFWMSGLVFVAGLLVLAFIALKNPTNPVQKSLPAVPFVEPTANYKIPTESNLTVTPQQRPIKPDDLSSPQNTTVPSSIVSTDKKKSYSTFGNSAANKSNSSEILKPNSNLPVEIDSKTNQNLPADGSESMVQNSREANDLARLRVIYPLIKLQTNHTLHRTQEELLLLPEIFIPVQLEQNIKKWKELGLRLGLAKQTESVRTNAISALGIEMYSQRQFGGKGYWGLSLGYNSFFNSSLYSEVLTAYQFKGFGAVVQNYGVKPEWMHYLYLQATVGVQWKKHRAFLGVRPELLLGALGKVDQLKFKEGSVIKDLATAEASSIGNGWLQKGSLHQMIFNSHLGYEYQFHHRIGIGLQANRHLNSLYRPLPGDIAQTHVAKWNLGMRVSYKIK